MPCKTLLDSVSKRNDWNLQATVFNHTEIAFILMDAGASVDAKNAQGCNDPICRLQLVELSSICYHAII
jgi:hypothetical protein